MFIVVPFKTLGTEDVEKPCFSKQRFKSLPHLHTRLINSAEFIPLQVSRLVRPTAGQEALAATAQHWFTATPDPMRSVFKPFTFLSSEQMAGVSITQLESMQKSDSPQLATSPYTQSCPALRNPPHPLWQAWCSVYEFQTCAKPPPKALRDLEMRGLEHNTNLSFSEAVLEEMRLYSSI